MSTSLDLLLLIVVGICMFFVGRCLGYREAMGDLAEYIATNVRIVKEYDEDDQEDDEDDQAGTDR